MPGIKRKGAEDSTSVSKTKKVKAAPVAISKSDKKFALKTGKKDSKKEDGDESKGKRTTKEKEIVKKVSIPSRPKEESDELVESDTTESENGFYGFSANDEESEGGVKLPGTEKSAKKGTKEQSGNTDAHVEVQSKLKGSTDGLNVTNSRESHIKQKQLAKERKAAKPNADDIQRAKNLWERLRIKSNVPKEERAKLIAEVLEIVTGRVHDFVFKHDSVRPIQTAIKYSNMQQKRMIAEELKGNYKELLAGKYSRHMIGKLLENGDDQIRDLIVPEFYGSIRRLINHPDASWMLDDIYRVKASKTQKAIMLREWYGPEFALLKSGDKSNPTADLSKILAESPEKRKPILDYLKVFINQLVQKKLTGFTMLHDAMLQYYLQLEPGSTDFSEFVRMVIGDKNEEEVDLLKNLAFTKSGAHLVCLVLAHGTAKDRKLILRSYKDIVELVASDVYGYQILITACDVTDDTRETTSRIFSELVALAKTEEKQAVQSEKIFGLALHPQGRVPLLYPFVGAAKWLMPKQEQQDFVEKIHELRQLTSKKDAEVRRMELVTPLSPSYIAVIAERAEDLVKEPFGCQFITGVLLSAVGDKSEAVTAVAKLAAGDPTTEEHVAKSANAGRMLKTLIAGGHFDPKKKAVVVTAPGLAAADALYSEVQEHVLEWATGESSFVVVALMEAEEFEGKTELKRKLKKSKMQLQKAAEGEEGGKGNAGARILLGLLD